MNVLKKCGFCYQTGDLICSRCLEVYCSVECQIRDWAEHKKVCIAIPKLFPSDSYMSILVGGESIESVVPKTILLNNKRSLKPLRKPNIPHGTVEVSVNREATANLSRDCTSSDPTNTPPSSPQNVTVTIQSNGEKSYSTSKIEELSPASANKFESALNKSSPTGARQKLHTIKTHHQAHSPKVITPTVPEDTSAQAASGNLTRPWLLHFPLERKVGEPFEVIVQYIVPDEPKRFWVILACHEAQCDKLLRDIHGQLNTNSESPKYDQIEIDEIYAAPFEEVYYRVVVLGKVDAAKSLIRVRLIDYGDVITLPATELRAPLLLMKNLRAFAFQVEVQNMSRELVLGDRILVKLIRSEEDRKIIELVPNEEKLATRARLLDILTASEEKQGGGGIIAILSSRKALVMLSSPSVKPIMKSLYNQLPEAASNFPITDNAKVGEIVCVDSLGVGWSRGIIVEQHLNNHLVYTIDNGTVELILKGQEVRELPAEYKRMPALILQMDISKVLMNELEFKRMCYVPSFAFSYERAEFDESRHVLKATLRDVDEKRLLAEVEFSEFMCNLKQIGIHYWPYTPQDKSIVRITSVLDVNTVIVCPQDKVNVYTELLQTVLPTLQPLVDAPTVDDVIVGVDDIMMPYRARVLKLISHTELELLDLDNGCIKKSPFNKLYAANVFVNNLPVYTMKVQIRDLNVATIQDHANIVEQLLQFKAEKKNLKLLFDGGSYMYGVKLLDVNSNRSLAVLLQENHDKKLSEAKEAIERKKQEQEAEAARQKAEADAAKQKAAAEAEAKQAEQERLERERKAEQQRLEHMKALEEEQRRKLEAERLIAEQELQKKAKAAEQAAKVCTKFNIQDLPLVDLPINKSDVKLTILDDGDLSQGVLTVCECNDDNVLRYKTLTSEVNKHAATLASEEGYKPEPDEMCVAIFDADQLWYRAVCLQVQPDNKSFVVQFIDYGNMATVNSKNIRRFTKELNFPCAAHMCTVNDVAKALETLTQQQSTLGHIIAREIQSKGDIYTLKI